MKNPKFTISKDKKGKFRFNLKAGNGQIILASQGYDSKAGCKNGIKSVKSNSKKEASFEVKKAKNGKDYFVLRARNKEIIGKSEMYNSASGCNNGVKSVMKNAPDAPTEDLS